LLDNDAGRILPPLEHACSAVTITAEHSNHGGSGVRDRAVLKRQKSLRKERMLGVLLSDCNKFSVDLIRVVVGSYSLIEGTTAASRTNSTNLSESNS
jgi:hypothetical protein